jgi:16S rRNA (cytosine1402-N4)-methyltransferase
MNYESIHKPVLLKEVISYLKLKKGDVIFDGTLGGAGHTIEIIKVIAPIGILIGVDLDSQAISTATRILQFRNIFNNFIFVNDNFSNVTNILKKLKINKVNGFLLDLGLSSNQIEKSGRGFSYLKNEKLDMRYGTGGTLNAYKVINEYSEDKLREIFYKYGEERWSGRIARKLLDYRKTQDIEYTGQLVDIIKSAIPVKSFSYRKGNPAKRIFQAIRIEVNEELKNLEKAIDEGIEVIESGGRMIIISYHSLEDRIVKRKFESLSGKCTCPPDFPVCRCGAVKKGSVITKKAVKPSQAEIVENPRSKSARLRVFEKN